VTAKCTGGPSTGSGQAASRKRKLLDQQKEGKEYGSVNVPQEAFIAAPQMDEE